MEIAPEVTGFWPAGAGTNIVAAGAVVCTVAGEVADCCCVCWDTGPVGEMVVGVDSGGCVGGVVTGAGGGEVVGAGNVMSTSLPS
jgi:hypothetical protein